MITTRRFDRAIDKLYTAFHSGLLHPECSRNCAVGNICENRDFWKGFSDEHGSIHLSYVGKINELFNRKFYGFSPSELLKIESAFLAGCGYELPLRKNSRRPENPFSKDILFNGLVEAVSQLCKLDGIPDVMDCSSLFEYERPDASKGLETV